MSLGSLNKNPGTNNNRGPQGSSASISQMSTLKEQYSSSHFVPNQEEPSANENAPGKRMNMKNRNAKQYQNMSTVINQIQKPQNP